MLAASTDLPKALSEAAGNVGDMQVRNRGTIGGNVVHADPGSDHPTVLTALGAKFHISGPNGERTVRAEDFCTFMFTTILKADEVLTGVEVPVLGKGAGSAYAKMPHPASGYAMLGAAALLSVDGDRCTSAGVAVGGVTYLATKSPSVEAALLGKVLNETVLADAARAVLDDLGDDLLGDPYTSADYRKAMTPIYVQRALQTAVQRARA
jgi:carbon-monoxide dehydrogenase medium subunit